jgi:hypothetical protein
VNIPAGERAARLGEAVAVLAGAAVLDEYEPCPGSHIVIRVTGLESDEAVGALGTYLTGLIAGLVAVDLSITERYVGALPEDAGQLRSEVERVIGTSNDVADHFRDTRRNPWIAECLAHVLLMIAGGEPGPCVPGRIWAVTLPHDKVSQQGLDLVAVYEDDSLPALCIGESKASELSAAPHLNRSIRLFREIDARDRDYQIRVVMINSLEAHLPAELREQVPGMFWRDRRLYMPVIGYSAVSDFDPTTNRPTTFGELLVALDRRRCVAIALNDFHTFFDGVSDAMRAAVDAYVAEEPE